MFLYKYEGLNTIVKKCYGNVPLALQVQRALHYREEVLWKYSSTSTEVSTLLWRSAVEVFICKYRSLHTIVKKKSED